MKVLYFDYWLKGIKHFLCIDNELKKYNFDTELLHLSSWGDEVKDKEVVIDGLLCRDISYYRNKKILDIICEIRPDVVIGLNLYYLTDRTLVLSCKKTDVPYVYLSHGRLTPIENLEDGRQLSNRSYHKRIWSRLKKNFVYVFPQYIYADLKLNYHCFNSLSQIMRVLYNPSKYITYSHYGNDLEAHKTMVYSSKDKEFLVKVRKFPESLIQVVGNPEMDNFSDVNYEVEQNKVMLYLDDGSVQAGILTKEQWYALLDDLLELAQQKGYELLVKLHPKTDMSQHQNYFEKCKDSLKIFQKESINELIKRASLCVSFYSSTILFSLMYRKRVLSPRWRDYKNIPRLYPDEVISYVDNKEDFWMMPNKNPQVIEEFLASEVGFTGEKAVPKIVENILKIANEVR